MSDKSVYKPGETYNNRSATESMMIGTTIVQKKNNYMGVLTFKSIVNDCMQRLEDKILLM